MLSALTVLPCFQQWFQSPVLTMWQYFTQRHTSKNQSCLLNKSRVYIKLGPVWKTLMLKETFCGRTMTALAAGYSHFTPPAPQTTPRPPPPPLLCLIESIETLVPQWFCLCVLQRSLLEWFLPPHSQAFIYSFFFSFLSFSYTVKISVWLTVQI